MKLKTVVMAAVVVSFAAPAMADQYYVVREPHAKHCTVTTTKPTTQTEITQIGPLAFETREKAEDRIKTTKVCSDDEDTTGSSVTIHEDHD